MFLGPASNLHIGSQIWEILSGPVFSRDLYHFSTLCSFTSQDTSLITLAGIHGIFLTNFLNVCYYMGLLLSDSVLAVKHLMLELEHLFQRMIYFCSSLFPQEIIIFSPWVLTSCHQQGSLGIHISALENCTRWFASKLCRHLYFFHFLWTVNLCLIYIYIYI